MNESETIEQTAEEAQAVPQEAKEQEQVTMDPERARRLVQEVTAVLQPLLEERERIQGRIESKRLGIEQVNKTINKKLAQLEDLEKEIKDLIYLGKDSSKQLMKKATLTTEVQTLREVTGEDPEGLDDDREQLEEVEMQLSRGGLDAVRKSAVFEEQGQRLIAALLEAAAIIKEWDALRNKSRDQLKLRHTMGQVDLRQPEEWPMRMKLKPVERFVRMI